MKNELTPTQKNIVMTIEEYGITDVIKPLINEIFLFDTYVAGTSHVDESVVSKVKVDEILTLQREKTNQFDNRAILIFNENKEKIGYVPEKDNIVFSRLMDAGKLLTAKVNDTECKGKYYKINIGIYLVDY